MARDGWTLGDLTGELAARGIDIDDVPSSEIEKFLCIEQPERVAQLIERDLVRGEHEPYWNEP